MASLNYPAGAPSTAAPPEPLNKALKGEKPLHREIEIDLDQHNIVINWTFRASGISNAGFSVDYNSRPGKENTFSLQDPRTRRTENGSTTSKPLYPASEITINFGSNLALYNDSLYKRLIFRAINDGLAASVLENQPRATYLNDQVLLQLHFIHDIHIEIKDPKVKIPDPAAELTDQDPDLFGDMLIDLKAAIPKTLCKEMLSAMEYERAPKQQLFN